MAVQSINNLFNWDTAKNSLGIASVIYLTVFIVNDVVNKIFQSIGENGRSVVKMIISFPIMLIGFNRIITHFFHSLPVALLALSYAIGSYCLKHHFTKKTDPSADLDLTTSTKLALSYFLQVVTPENPSLGRSKQVLQVRQAIGGIESPHALIIGSSENEVSILISQLSIEGYTVVRINPQKVGSMDSDPAQFIEESCDYFSSHPKTIFYLSSLDLYLLSLKDISNLRKSLSQLPSETYVIGTLSEEMAVQCQDQLNQFKKVKLAPLSQEDCLTEIKQWTESETFKNHYPVTFEENALSTAVKIAFLLLEGNGNEYSFTQDLIERASNTNKFIITKNLLEIFPALYPLYKKKKDPQIQYLELFSRTEQKKEVDFSKENEKLDTEKINSIITGIEKNTISLC